MGVGVEAIRTRFRLYLYPTRLAELRSGRVGAAAQRYWRPQLTCKIGRPRHLNLSGNGCRLRRSTQHLLSGRSYNAFQTRSISWAAVNWTYSGQGFL
jgi:hypothetical protein